jgi:Phytanoyl-CoA dioxygenase (PhyH)
MLTAKDAREREMTSSASKEPDSALISQIERLGFAVVPAVFDPVEIDAITTELTQALVIGRAGVLEQAGRIYAARNIMQLWPKVADVWRRPPLPEILRDILGAKFGLVRVLFFDKPPEQSWSLPWHKDLTIAVRNNRLASRQFKHPTTKSGVPHVEASQAVLDGMLTARLHLDDVTEENGPMKVIPGSHITGKASNMDESKSQTVLAKRGDVLLIRPLVEHNSVPSRSGNLQHRRILHLEFVNSPDLPDGYEWHDYVPGCAPHL